MSERLEVQLGAAKIAKYASGESGDTLEVIERPHGGLSAVLVDGQRSGRSAKIISNIVARKAVSLLGEGVRDGAVARAVHDYLRTHRGGQVSAELLMTSVDLATRTLVISRNARCRSFVWRQGAMEILEADSVPIGIQAFTKPSIIEIPLEAGTYVVLATDGLFVAAEKMPSEHSPEAEIRIHAQARVPAQSVADGLLAKALAAESGRPRDDISIVVVAVLPDKARDRVRRLSARFPM